MTVKWVRSAEAGVEYPAAPWTMVGSLWLTLFHVRGGLHGAAFVSYAEGSPLTYSELLVAHPVKGRCVTISDIWVDSPASVAGGRELWAIPKGLCDFELDTVRRGPLTTTEWTARQGRTPIASATFHDLSRAALRTPFKGVTWQPGIDDTDGQERTATLKGTAKSLPARARWEFDAAGPLGWLTGARQLASFRMADFRMEFGAD